ncbi:MAG: 2-iminoacetate synthase ThiH [Syntrophobacteraceae bacterium]|nr:2-iminoacetate synthase ThiH [Syntrophobacteraceae bacterium]
MSFYDQIKHTNWAEMEKEIAGRSGSDVESALGAVCSGGVDLSHFISLLSPAAEKYLEETAGHAHNITRRRFGNTMGLFAPLYVSNFCNNSCCYCGFNAKNPVRRLTLTPQQARAEGEFIRRMGFRQLLLVSGEAPQIVPVDYFLEITGLLKPIFSSVGVEIYPMDVEEYRALIECGVDGLTVFQETYNERGYERFHLGGRKQNFRWRLETPDRGGEAGFRRIGLGALLGLENWRVEGFYMGLHAQYLMRKYWKSQVSISFPRLRPAAGSFEVPCEVSDRNFVQLLIALRLFLPDTGFTLSTREPAELRDHLIALGITSMSAGSKTEPGGYTHPQQGGAEAQFEISDDRDPETVADVIRQKGYEPVWKDWDEALS